MTKNLFIGVLVVALVGVVGFFLVNPTNGVLGGGEATGQVHYQKEHFIEGFYAGTNRQLEIGRDGSVSSTAAFTVGSGGTAISKYWCATSTYNPTSFSSTTIASTTLNLSGLVLGDLVLASFDSATSSEQWRAVPNVNKNGSSTVNLVAIPGTTAWNAGLDITTSTLKVCAIH